MEIVKVILTAVGTFLSVLALSFTVFQYWRKKQEERIDNLKTGLGASIDTERKERKEEIGQLRQKVEKLESMVLQNFESRLSSIEGLLRGIRPIMEKIQEWFINNTPRGK